MKRSDFPVVLGMIQPEPCPGSYNNHGMRIDEIIDVSLREVKMLNENSFDGYIIQNRNDAPVQMHAQPQNISYMTVLAKALKDAYPHLIQGILINWDGVASLAVADAVSADFVRIEHTYTGLEVGYAGLMSAQCVEVCEFRKKLGTSVPVYADVQEVHYEQLGRKPIVEAATDAVQNAFADGLFLGGKSAQGSIDIIQAVREKLGKELPILLSSGATDENISQILEHYDGVSVGSWVKNGNLKNPIDPERAKIFMREAEKAKKRRA